jgi:hypothetical protein
MDDPEHIKEIKPGSFHSDTIPSKKIDEIPPGSFLAEQNLSANQKEILQDSSSRAQELFDARDESSPFVGLGSIAIGDTNMKYLIVSKKANSDLENFLGVLDGGAVYVSEQLNATAEQLGLSNQAFIEAQIRHEVYEEVLGMAIECAEATAMDLAWYNSHDPDNYYKYVNYRLKFFKNIVRYYRKLIEANPESPESDQYELRIKKFNSSIGLLEVELSRLSNKADKDS